MTLYLILGRHGARIHPVSNRDRDNIRYLPLLVLKDMIKSNLNDRIRYIKDHKKTVVFFEHTELHYIAISKTNSYHLLLQHLIIIQSYLSFMYGPAFATRLSTTQPSPFQPNRASLSPISPSELSSATARIISLCRLNPYLAVQPIQVSEDLRKRFRVSLREGCDNAFTASEKRKSSFGSAFQALSMQSMREEPSPLPNGNWSHAMLWVQDKLLVRCNNGSADRSPYDMDSNELLAVLVLVQSFLKAHAMNDSSDPGDLPATTAHQNTKPQMIRTSRSSNHSLDTHHSRTPDSTNSSTIATPPSSGGYVPSSFALSNKSSASNIASITNVTPVVSFSTPPQLSLMLFSNQNPSIHTTDSVSFSDNESIAHSEPVSISRSQSRPESCHSGSFGSTLSADHEPRPVSVPIGHHRRSSPVPSDPLSSSLSLLSSSLPASSAVSYPLPTGQKTSGARRPVNAMSRQHQRSRSSIDSLTKLLPPMTPEPSESKVTTAWFKVGDELQEKCVYLGQVSEGVTLVIIYDPPKQSNPSLKPRHLTKLQSQLRVNLADFSSFLLTKEQTHFSMLSVLTNYPGLVHFVYMDGTGVMVRPIVTDLRYQAEVLGQGRWRDLSVDIINTALHHLLDFASQYRDSSYTGVHILGVPNHCPVAARLHYVYQRFNKQQELFALYLDDMSSAQVGHLHEKLAHDLSKQTV